MDESTCHLCSLPLRYGAVSHSVDDQPLRFCCQGCRMVYSMLLESAEVDDPTHFKETDLYRQCVAAGVIPASEDDLKRINAREKQETQASAKPIEDEQAVPDPSGTLALDLMVEGMWCKACAWVIEKTVSRLNGVQAASCHFSTDRLRCRYRPDRVAPDQIRKSVTHLGYGLRESGAAKVGQRAQRKELIRLIIAGLLSANVMML
ncbi:cation transporter, partial [Desulfosarcina sp.]|uniref:cation transporter n=1 Tax=Desulfosarcina sp. TaxID=2027861 RepID=UPI0029BD775E